MISTRRFILRKPTARLWLNRAHLHPELHLIRQGAETAGRWEHSQVAELEASLLDGFYDLVSHGPFASECIQKERLAFVFFKQVLHSCQRLLRNLALGQDPFQLSRRQHPASGTHQLRHKHGFVAKGAAHIEHGMARGDGPHQIAVLAAQQDIPKQEFFDLQVVPNPRRRRGDRVQQIRDGVAAVGVGHQLSGLGDGLGRSLALGTKNALMGRVEKHARMGLELGKIGLGIAENFFHRPAC